MANQPITSAAGSIGSSGANIQVQYLANMAVKARRNSGGPLRYMTDVSAQIMGQGDTCKVWSAPNLTSRTLVDGADIVKDDDTGSSATVTINRQRYSAFSMTTVGAALGGNVMAQDRIYSAIAAVLNGMEEDVLSLASGFTNNTAQGTSNTAITEAEMVDCSAILDSAKIPKPYIGLIRPDAKGWYALTQIANFTAADHTGLSNPKFEDGLGAGRLFHGVRWFPCHAVNKSGSTTYNLVFNPQALAVAMRMPEAPQTNAAQAYNIFDAESGIAFQVIEQYDPSTISNEFVVRVLYGYAEVSDDHAIQLLS